MTYMEAFYMSCITLTTVGFGDFTPMSQHGRNFVRAFSEVFMMEAQKSREVDVKSCFHIIDKDGDGTLDRFEFVSFILLEHGLVTAEMLNDINSQYDILDSSKTGRVTLQMIMDHETGGKLTVGKKPEEKQAGGASHLLRKATSAANSSAKPSKYAAAPFARGMPHWARAFLGWPQAFCRASSPLIPGHPGSRE